MILSDRDIRKAMADGEISLTPYDDRLLKRNSYLLRLDSQFRTADGDATVDTAVAADLAEYAGAVRQSDSIVVTSTSLVLGCSLERLTLGPGLVALLSGVSNVARLGVQLHCTSQLVNAGFAEHRPSRVVFEMATVGGRRVRLYAGTPVCHLVFARLDSPASDRPESRRSGQDGPDPSELLAQFGHFYVPAADVPPPSVGKSTTRVCSGGRT